MGKDALVDIMQSSVGSSVHVGHQLAHDWACSQVRDVIWLTIGGRSYLLTFDW